MHIQAVIEPLGVCIGREEVNRHPDGACGEGDMRRKGTGGGGEHEIGKDPSTTIDRVSLAIPGYVVETGHERRKPICALWLAHPQNSPQKLGPITAFPWDEER